MNTISINRSFSIKNISKAILLLLVVTCLIPAFAQAQSATSSPVGAPVNLPANTVMPSPTMPPMLCWFRFSNDLKLGNGNAKINSEKTREVSALQTFLYSEGFLKVQSTGYFGPQTLAAVKKFQAANNIPATGMVGPMTRSRIHKNIGCQTDELSILSITGPSQIAVNQQGSWSVNVRNEMNAQLSYSVDWGDMPIAVTPASASGNSMTAKYDQQTSSFTHTYTKGGTYTLTFFVYGMRNSFVTAQKSMQITVIDPNTPKITITSPNGGEKWTNGTVETLRWNMTNNTDPNKKVDLYLSYVGIIAPCLPGAQCPNNQQEYVLDQNIAWNYAYPWIVGTDMYDRPIPAGEFYLLKVCEAGSTINCDQSNTYFSLLNAANPNNRTPVINGLTGPTTLKVGETGTWYISASDPDGDRLTQIATWDIVAGGINISSSLPHSGTFTQAFQSAGNYALTFKVTDPYGKSAEVKTTLRVQN